MVHEAIIAALKANTDITEEVSARIYCDGYVPQTTARPFVTVGIISDVAEQTAQGPTGAVMALTEITAWADTPAVSYELSDTVRLAIDNIQGWYAGIYLETATRTNRREIPGQRVSGKEYPLAGMACEFEVWYHETT